MRSQARVIPILLLVFLGGYPMSAQRLDLGVEGGLRATDDIGGGNAILSGTPESKRYIVGPMLAVRLPKHLSFEFDALYRRIGFTSRFNSPFPGFSTVTRERANSWEFPMILKYRFARTRVNPFAGGGYAPRTVNGTDVSSGSFVDQAGQIRPYFNQRAGTRYPLTHGLVVSGGVDFNARHLRVSPEIRYVRWNAPFLNDNAGSPSVFPPFASKQDEVFVLVGISWH